MAQTYSTEFKKEACKRVQSGVPAAQVARELDQCKYPLLMDVPV